MARAPIDEPHEPSNEPSTGPAPRSHEPRELRRHEATTQQHDGSRRSQHAAHVHARPWRKTLAT